MKKVIGFGILFFVVIHLFGAMAYFGRNQHNSASAAQEAWTQGYMAGQRATAGEGAAENAAPPSYTDGMEGHGRYGYGHGYEYGQYGHGRHPMGIFSIFGMLFRCLIPFFLIGGLFALFGKRCRRHGHGKGESGRRCGPPWTWHRPPWAKDGEEQDPRWVADDENIGNEKSPE